jgi:hypothetical protein
VLVLVSSVLRCGLGLCDRSLVPVDCLLCLSMFELVSRICFEQVDACVCVAGWVRPCVCDRWGGVCWDLHSFLAAVMLLGGYEAGTVPLGGGGGGVAHMVEQAERQSSTLGMDVCRDV